MLVTSLLFVVTPITNSNFHTHYSHFNQFSDVVAAYKHKQICLYSESIIPNSISEYHHPSCEECREGRRSIDVNHTSQLEALIYFSGSGSGSGFASGSGFPGFPYAQILLFISSLKEHYHVFAHAQEFDFRTGGILVPRGRAPFGQHQESRPLASSSYGNPRFTDFPSLCTCSESSLANLIGSGLNLLCLQIHSKLECRWNWPEVAILGADQKERGLWVREWNRGLRIQRCGN